MVAPITGPFVTVRSNSYNGPGSFWYSQSKRKQAKPYNLVIPYYLMYRRVDSCWGPQWSWPNGNASSNSDILDAVFYDAAHVETYDARFRAMERLRGKISEKAEWLLNLAERRQAISMIAKRAGLLIRVVRAVRRGDFKAANRLLSVPKGFRPKAKTFSGQWLEYHFGWSPLVGDIGTGIEILQKPIADKRVFAVARTLRPYSITQSDSNWRTFTQGTKAVTCRVGTYIRVSNPNLYLANQLGFINPVGLVWEMVPFSFVVDWFVPVGTFLNSFTEFVGLELLHPYHTTMSHMKMAYTFHAKVSGLESYGWEKRAVCVDRRTGLPSASLRPPTLRGLSATRAATAISLLIQLFVNPNQR